jgi:glutathione synthase/RimK-type ligase-like ATP-grasp enzyme
MQQSAPRDDARGALGQALEAEREDRFEESRRLCEQALSDVRLHPDAFNLLGRLRGRAGDAATAIAFQRFALRLEPGHARAASDLAAVLDAIPSSADAQAAFSRAVARAPEIVRHYRHPASLQRFAGMDTIEQLIERACERDPSFAPARAALANIYARQARLAAATDAYRLAAMLDWECADVHLALAYLFEALHDDTSAARHRDEALTRKHLYLEKAGAPVRHVLVAMAPGGATTNAPLDFCINTSRDALHRYYLVDDLQERDTLPACDIVFTAVEGADASAETIARAVRLVDAQKLPVINDPRRLANLRRSLLPAVIGHVPNCTIAQTRRVEHDEARVVTDFPIIIRPAGTQGGKGLERIANTLELSDYLENYTADSFHVAPFVDYRNPDSYYRKYRVIVIGGRPFAYHLAISDSWMVHYHSSLMEQHAWMRAEEEQFLREPDSIFVHWHTLFADIATSLGLDYFGVDCTPMPDGSVFIFECGSGMFVHGVESPPFEYKFPAIARIFSALGDMIAARANEAGP